MDEQNPKPTIEVIDSNEDMAECIKSKSFKQRILAYNNIHRFPQYINQLQHETLAIALEAAIDILLETAVRNDQIEALYNQLGQPKASIRTKILDLISKVYMNDRNNVITSLVEHTTAKSPKVSVQCIIKLNVLINEDMEYFRNNKSLLEDLLNKLEGIFGSVDKEVKSEAHVLSVTLYKIYYEKLLNYLKNIKSILLEDLKESFGKIETPRIEIKMSDFNFEDSNWKERLRSMTYLRDNIKNMTNANEYHGLVARKIKDTNLSVVVCAIETIRNGEIKHNEALRAMIDKLKDKKTVITNTIKETLIEIKPDIEIYLEFLNCKNNEIKIGVLDVLNSYDNIKTLLKDIGKLLEDSSQEVRTKAMNILIKVENISELSDVQIAKIQKYKSTNLKGVDSRNDSLNNISKDISKTTESPLNKSTASIKSPSNGIYSSAVKDSDIKPKQPNGISKGLNIASTIRPRTSLSSSDSPLRSAPRNSHIPIVLDYKIELGEKERIIGYFNDKYPQLNDKNWNRKLEFIKGGEIKETGDNIADYLLASKESNIIIVNEILGMFLEKDIPDKLIFYLFSKITEAKIRNTTISILKRFEDQDYLAKCFVTHLSHNKIGKKCVCMLEIFGEVLSQKFSSVDEFLSGFTCLGMNEKTALMAFKSQYELLSNEPPAKTIKNVSDISQSSNKTVPNASNTNKIIPFDSDNNLTDQFMNMFKKDPTKGIELLESNEIRSAMPVIKLYSDLDLSSPAFNSLILLLISQKYILKDGEAYELLTYLINRKMDTEMDLIDRVYPATKIYKILRSLLCYDYIIKLLNKYKKNTPIIRMDKYMVNSLYDAIKDNEDFVGFSMAVDKILKMKQNLQQNYCLNETNIPDCDLIGLEAINDCSIQEKPTGDLGNDSLLRKPTYISFHMNENDQMMDLIDNEISEPLELNKDKINYDFSNLSIASTPQKKILKDTQNTNESIFENEDSNSSIKNNLEDPLIFNNTFIDLISDGNDLITDYHDNIPTQTDNRQLIHFSDPGSNMDIILNSSLVNISGSSLNHPGNSSETFLMSFSREKREVSRHDIDRLTKMILEESEVLSRYISIIIKCIVLKLSLEEDYYNMDIEMKEVLLGFIMRISLSPMICNVLNFEVLTILHNYLISAINDSIYPADILINLCINCDLCILSVYFNILSGPSEVLMKLIWRHSKKVDFSNKENVATILEIQDVFYKEKGSLLAKSENVLLKICLLHLKECISVYSDNVLKFGVSTITTKLVNTIMESQELNLEKIRRCFDEESNQKK